jgi:hypothetical protein
MARAARRLARLAAAVEQTEEATAREIRRAQTSPRGPVRALLIINSKSGLATDSLLRVRELVDLLAAHHIAADVRVKLHKSQARREARAAAKAGYRLVLAARGDGTVAAVARGLVGSGTVLGTIPLGTYNNVGHLTGDSSRRRTSVCVDRRRSRTSGRRGRSTGARHETPAGVPRSWREGRQVVPLRDKSSLLLWELLCWRPWPSPHIAWPTSRAT